MAFVDQGYTGEQPKQDAQASGIEWVVEKVDEAQKGFVLLPRRLGGRAAFWLDGTLSAPGAGLRAHPCNPGWASFRRLCHAHAGLIHPFHRFGGVKVHNTLWASPAWVPFLSGVKIVFAGLKLT